MKTVSLILITTLLLSATAEARSGTTISGGGCPKGAMCTPMPPTISGQ